MSIYNAHSQTWRWKSFFAKLQSLSLLKAVAEISFLIVLYAVLRHYSSDVYEAAMGFFCVGLIVILNQFDAGDLADRSWRRRFVATIGIVVPSIALAGADLALMAAIFFPLAANLTTLARATAATERGERSSDRAS